MKFTAINAWGSGRQRRTADTADFQCWSFELNSQQGLSGE